MSQVVIQKIGIESATILSTLAVQAYRDHYLYLWQDDNADWYIHRCFTTEALSKELIDSQNAFFLIYHSQSLVGFLKLIYQHPLPDYCTDNSSSISPNDYLYLERIYFLKSAVGKGLGAQVMAFVHDEALKINASFVWLSAMDSSTKPIQFYQKMGFSICGTKHLDFPLIQAGLNGMVVMKKPVFPVSLKSENIV